VDRIELRGLRVLGTHGVLDEERARAQPFEVDVVIEADLAAARTSDDLADTVDYGAVAQLVERVVAGESYALMERMAERIAEEVIALDARAEVVEVSVWKLRPPVPVDLDRAGVTVTVARPRA
jgi:dihydroneopterin aldolase